MSRDITVSMPEGIASHIPEIEHVEFKCFLQLMTNRRAVGGLRYGRAKATTKFLTRLKKEVEAYERTGNMEQLINIANYAFLESFAPENRKFHFDPTVDSVTGGGKR